jgi:hypothetical protein
MWLQVFKNHIQPGLSLVEQLSAPSDFDEESKAEYSENREKLRKWSKKASDDIKVLVKSVRSCSGLS